MMQTGPSISTITSTTINGVGNLTYTVANNTNTAVDASVSGNTLTLAFPATPEVTELTLRATDTDGLFAEQTFTVTVSDQPVPVLRIRANGATLAATDAPNPDWVGRQPVPAHTAVLLTT